MSDSTSPGDTLRNLRLHIDELHADDAASRAHLSGLADDIEARLGRAEGAGAGEGDELAGRMNASVLQFEATHPRVAKLLNDLTEQLGKMGI